MLTITIIKKRRLLLTMLTLIALWGDGSLLAQGLPLEIPNEALWASSGHADDTAEAFRHWDNDGVVPTSCAKCHSGLGFQDFLGADGTEAGVVDNPAAPSVHTCVTCHNDAARELDSVVFPSGVEVTGLGNEALCMQCHQGRSSTISVDTAITDANVADDDAFTSSLRFINIHYFAAAATRMGGKALGGYQYNNNDYDAKFAHVAGVDTCVSCHDPHSLEIQIDKCTTCHDGVGTDYALQDIRLRGSTSDYDGDRDVTEGIFYEIQGLQEILYGAIRSYAEAAGSPIVYDAHAYPYFFADDNNNGQVDEGEGRYAAFSPRLLKAVYNYQTSIKDPGGFAHGGKYLIQLLYDSIEDLDADLVVGLRRTDSGHFAGSEEAWRHWDEDGAVPGSCSKCHSATGLPFFLEEGVTVSQPVSNGMLCTTCHDAVPEFTRHEVEEVEFPSGAVLTTGDSDSNLCLNCHQGRESGLSIVDAVAGLEADTVSSSLRFINVHYFAAGATRFGSEAGGAYEYENKNYTGYFRHVTSFDSCIECHDTHSLRVEVRECVRCHQGIREPQDIRRDQRDFDGDGDTMEGIAAEIGTFVERLYEGMQAYAAAGTPLVYDSHSFPYFFVDSNGNGEVDPGEASYSNQYRAWTPRLLKAAYNFQYAQKDPGAFAHNSKYVIQALHDSLEDLGTVVPVNMMGMTRP